MKQQSLPLSKYTVLDLSIARAGPTAVRMLADWGADVIRIESPISGDIAGQRQGPDSQNLHRNKRSLCIDLKSDAASKYASTDESRRPQRILTVAISPVRPEFCKHTGFPDNDPQPWLILGAEVLVHKPPKCNLRSDPGSSKHFENVRQFDYLVHATD